MARREYGSVVRIHIQQVCLRYFSLLPASVATTTAMPAVEAITATIGLRGLTSFTQAPSTSTAEVSVWATTSARMGSLSVASR